jgi:hypothetical protein
VRPQIGGAAFESGEGNLRVEHPRPDDREVGCDLHQTIARRARACSGVRERCA